MHVEGEALNSFWDFSGVQLSWIAYPILGFLFGKMLIHCTDKIEEQCKQGHNIAIKIKGVVP